MKPPTDSEFEILHRRRVLAWERLPLCGACPPATDAALRERRDDNRTIVRELRWRGRPAVLSSGNQLRLTADRLNYLETDPAGRPVGIAPYDRRNRRDGRGACYRYAGAAGQGGAA